MATATGIACQPPHESFSVGEVGPKEGVALNAPLLVRFDVQDHDPERQDIEQELAPTLELRVAGSDAVLERLQPIRLGARLLSFMPSSKLMPNTNYAVSVSLVSDATDASQLVGGEKASWELTTSDEVRETLVMSNEWSVTFEPGVDDELECDEFGSCGPECFPTGKKLAVTKARITLPSVSGGFSEEFLAGTLGILPAQSVAQPLSISDVDLQPGKRAEVVVTMPLQEGKTYAPCFQFQAQDAIDTKPMSTFCQDEPFPAPAATDEPDPISDPEPEPELKPEPRPSTHPELPVDTGHDAGDDSLDPSSRQSSSCSMGGASRGGAASALLVVLGVASLSRRRRGLK